MTTITVLMPAFNAARYIAAAVDSVLAQTYQDLDLLVVDDGSTDGTADIVLTRADDPRVRLLRHPRNLGLVAALNHGLAECRTDLVARLDADDTTTPDRLALQVKVFADPRVVLCATGHRRIDPGGTTLHVGCPPLTHGAFAVAMLTGNRVNHSAAMYRADVVRAAGGYRPEWFPVEDYDLWLRLIGMGRFVGIADVGVVTVNDAHGVSMQHSEEQARLHRLRTEIYVRETHGAELSERDLERLLSADDGNLRSVRAVARCGANLRADLTGRGLPTTGVDGEARRLALRAMARRRKLARHLILCVGSPRLALLGVLDDRQRPAT